MLYFCVSIGGTHLIVYLHYQASVPLKKETYLPNDQFAGFSFKGIKINCTFYQDLLSSSTKYKFHSVSYSYFQNQAHFEYLLFYMQKFRVFPTLHLSVLICLCPPYLAVKQVSQFTLN